MAALTPPQVRLLSLLARDSAWHNRDALAQVKLLEAGDANEIDALAEAGLVIVNGADRGIVRISPAGAVRVEEEGRVTNDVDRLKTFIRSGILYHEGD